MKGYETRDVRMAPILGFMLALLIVFTVSLWAMARLDERLRPEPEPGHALGAERVLPPQPRLEVESGVLQEDAARRAAIELESYGWIDVEAGRIRVPIERALELALEEGFPTR